MMIVIVVINVRMQKRGVERSDWHCQCQDKGLDPYTHASRCHQKL
jgi:hypothetical protein